MLPSFADFIGISFGSRHLAKAKAKAKAIGLSFWVLDEAKKLIGQLPSWAALKIAVSFQLVFAVGLLKVYLVLLWDGICSFSR